MSDKKKEKTKIKKELNTYNTIEKEERIKKKLEIE